MASEYHRGEMDISEQVATFNLFNGMTKWGSLFLASLLSLLVLWFCTPAGFGGGFVTAAIVATLGTALLREKPAADH